MPAIESIAQALDGAVAEGHAVGVVGVVVGRDGEILHESAHGARAVGGDAMTADSVFRAFSMTKAVGTVAAMKLVEEGSLSLDTPVEEVLPEFAEIQVLDGFDGDTPKLRAPKTKCTLRHLATHTSGFTYDVWNANQTKYFEATEGFPTLSGQLASLKCFPMQFDPGERWAYGMSTDWLGRMVEEASGERIDAFLKREVLGPLGMTSTDVEITPDMASRKVGVSAATPDGFVPIEMDLPSNPEFYGMGHALNTTGGDYARFCAMILGGGAVGGARVLSEDAVAMMSQRGEPAATVVTQATVNPALSADMDFFPGVDKCYTLGFMRNEQDVPGRRRAGSLSWAGVMNTHYWIDPTTGIAGVIMMQHLPFVDAHAMAAYEAFETATYAALS
ncbi:MAG: serine hydrolase domain-containing protein [Pseudomonadota bacterium]